MKKLLVASIVAFPMMSFAGAALADSKEEKAAAAAALAASKITTVFVSGKGMDSYAKKLNESYVAAQAQGWKFADLEIYVENGDMVGAFVTYVKD